MSQQHEWSRGGRALVEAIAVGSGKGESLEKYTRT